MCSLGEELRSTKDKTFIGWRFWSADWMDGKLTSPFWVKTRWPAATKMSQYTLYSGGNSGLYSFKTLKKAKEYLVECISGTSGWANRNFVFGKVEVSGQVFEHVDGYRSRRVRILSIGCDKTAKLYGVAYSPHGLVGPSKYLLKRRKQ